MQKLARIEPTSKLEPVSVILRSERYLKLIEVIGQDEAEHSGNGVSLCPAHKYV